MDKLAIFGGKSAVIESLLSSVVIDEDERKLVNKVLDEKEFSRFMGSPTDDINEMLVMHSVDAVSYKSQYFTFLGGRMVRWFESDFAKFFGVDFAISVNSATTGLATALGAAGVGPGDEVITTCLSFNATAMSVLLFNSIPVFVDISPKTFCLDPILVEKAITDKTKAILVVHLLGFPVEMDMIMEIAKKYNLIVVEDCAQAPGTKYKGQYVGTIGHIGVFSFQETKNMMTGEGGMIVTRDPHLAKGCRVIRNHGESITTDRWTEHELINMVGFNFRMTELTAAMGIAQLKKLPKNNQIRKDNATYVINRLQGIPGLKTVAFEDEWVPHILPLLYDETVTHVFRDTIIKALRAEGVIVGSGYPRLMCEYPIFQRKIAYGSEKCPWSCHLYNGNTSYDLSNFSVAKEMIGRRFIWFYHIHAPNTLKQMEEVSVAFHKVFSNLDLLREYKDNSKVRYKW